MLNKLNVVLNELFGPQGWELAARKTKDLRVMKLLRVVSILRFLVFPISLCIYIVALIVETTLILLALFSNFLQFLFETVNDSSWIDIRWFKLTFEELNKEVVAGNSKKKRTRVPKAEQENV